MAVFALRRYVSYWVLPVVASFVWLATLLSLLLYWTVNQGRPFYPSMTAGQRIAYISDVGATTTMKPVFIVGCCVSAVLLDAAFFADRWLRHQGRLVPNSTRGEKILSGLTIVFALVGTAGLCLLSGFDTLRYPNLHDVFLLLFMGGYVLSAVFICWEYQRLGIRNRDHRVLRISFWIKLSFVLVAVGLVVAFVALTWTRHYDAGAIMEWTIAFFFTFYIASFYVDLYPAVFTKPGSGSGARRHPKRRDLGDPSHHAATTSDEFSDPGAGAGPAPGTPAADVYLDHAASSAAANREMAEAAPRPVWLANGGPGTATRGLGNSSAASLDHHQSLRLHTGLTPPPGVDWGTMPATPKAVRTPIDF